MTWLILTYIYHSIEYFNLEIVNIHITRIDWENFPKSPNQVVMIVWQKWLTLKIGIKTIRLLPENVTICPFVHTTQNWSSLLVLPFHPDIILNVRQCCCFTILGGRDWPEKIYFIFFSYSHESKKFIASPERGWLLIFNQYL